MPNTLEIKIKANAKKTGFLDEHTLAVKAPAQDNKANIEIVRFLSRHYKKKVRILSGLKNKNKVVVIDD